MVEEKKHIHILVVDDELGMRDLLSLELKGQGYQVSVAENGKEATEIIRKQKFDLVISDLSMPQMDGITLLQNIKEVDPELEVIMATGHGTIESAVKAMKNGAYDFILKPFNLDELSLLIEKALEKKKLKTLLALSEASQAVFSTIELDRLLEVIMAMLQKVLGADECSIMLLNEKNKLAIVASHGLSSEIAQHTQLEIGERVAGAVAKERRARLLIDGLENYPEFSGVESNKRVKSSIICPLLSQGELLGVLNISRTNQGNNFNWNDLQSTIIFASQAASAIQNAKLYQNLKKANQEI
ncbi:MAG: response regulator, partial [Candidatus Omnitrophica bacterium]|nr:response regulator [Candidatus Omnitrophota bacterium]